MTKVRRWALAATSIVLAVSSGSSAVAHEPAGGKRVESHEHQPRRALRGPSHRHRIKRAQSRRHQHAHARDEARKHAGAPENGDDHKHGFETENLFGFTLGSDTDDAGVKTVAFETVARFGKRGGSYTGIGQKLEFGFGVTDNFNLSFSALGDYHRVRNVPDLDDVRGRYAFNGFGGEVRWRFLDRKHAPFGMTLQLEPSVSRIDEVSGQAGRVLGSENKLIFDRELVPEKLFGAINLLYDVEKVKERGEPTERSANAGIAAAFAYQVAPKLFLGGEARYLRAYEGFGLKRWQGEALYVGPTLYTQFQQNAWLSLSWNMQVAGRQATNRRERAEAFSEFLGESAGYAEAATAALEAGEDLPSPPSLPGIGRRGRLDLANFERHQLRVKIGFEF